MYRKFFVLSVLLVFFATAATANIKITENGINFSEAENPFISGIRIDNVVEDQGLSVNSSSVNDTLEITNGTSATIHDNYEKDTNASTECSLGEVLAGGGCVSRYSSSDDADSSIGNEGLGSISFDTSTGILTLGRKNQVSLTEDLDGRYAENNTQLDDRAAQSDVDLNNYSLLNVNWSGSDNPNTDNQTLSDVLNQGNKVNAGQNLNVTQGTMQIPVGEDAY